MDCCIASSGEVFSGSYTYTSTITDYTDGTINLNKVIDFSDLQMPGKNLSSIILWRISRIGGSGSDTYPQDARLLEFDIHYQIDSLGSNEEYEKF